MRSPRTSSRSSSPSAASTLRPRTVNWKNVGDNYSDGLHIPRGASGAHAVVRRDVSRRIARVDRPHVGRASPTNRRATGRSACTRNICPMRRHLAADKRRSWVYFKLWPNFAFDVYPDQVDIMQWLPVSPTETLIREIGYARPDDAPRNARRALLQLAHQPPGERRGHACSSSACRMAWRRAATARVRWRPAKSRCAASARACAS